MIPPDISFHRYLQSPEVQARYRYKGRQKLAELDKLGQYMASVQETLNISYKTQCQGFLVNGAHPNLYCDYIEPSPQSLTLINAHAFYDGHYFFLGLTTPLVARLSECADLLSYSPHISKVVQHSFRR